MDPGTETGTSDNVPEPTSAMTWRAKKGLLEEMTGTTWPDPGLSQSQKHERIRFAEIFRRTVWRTGSVAERPHLPKWTRLKDGMQKNG